MAIEPRFNEEELRHLNPEFLRAWGFTDRAQVTSDPQRMVRWSRILPNEMLIAADEDHEGEQPLSFELVLHYWLSIHDDPYASYEDNHTYHFERAWVQVVDAKRREASDGFRRNLEGRYEEQDEFVEEGGLVGLPVEIETVGDLMRILATFGVRVPAPDVGERSLDGTGPEHRDESEEE